jgi:hypothetical protein
MSGKEEELSLGFILFILFILLIIASIIIECFTEFPVVSSIIAAFIVVILIIGWKEREKERERKERERIAFEEEKKDRLRDEEIEALIPAGYRIITPEQVREWKERERKERERIAFEEEQRNKGIVKFVDRSGNEKWGRPEQVREWKKIDIGMENDFADINPIDFERFIADLFRKMGYRVDLTPATGDYGADLIAVKDMNRIVVQVKRYSPNNPVGAPTVQQTLGSMWKYNANKSILVTTSYFTKQAIEQARNAPIELWDREKLYRLIDRYFLL